MYLHLFFTLALDGGEIYIKPWLSVVSIDVYANACVMIKLHSAVKFYFIRHLFSLQVYCILAFVLCK